jgi:hypothetical protein
LDDLSQGAVDGAKATDSASADAGDEAVVENRSGEGGGDGQSDAGQGQQQEGQQQEGQQQQQQQQQSGAQQTNAASSTASNGGSAPTVGLSEEAVRETGLRVTRLAARAVAAKEVGAKKLAPSAVSLPTPNEQTPVQEMAGAPATSFTPMHAMMRMRHKSRQGAVAVEDDGEQEDANDVDDVPLQRPEPRSFAAAAAARKIRVRVACGGRWTSCERAVACIQDCMVPEAVERARLCS